MNVFGPEISILLRLQRTQSIRKIEVLNFETQFLRQAFELANDEHCFKLGI